MDDLKYFEFIYSEYKAEFEQSSAMYQRAAVLLGGIVLVGGAAIAIARPELLGKASAGGSVFFLHCACAWVMSALVVATWFCCAAALPRDYPKISKAFFWQRWRAEYWAILVSDAPDDEATNKRFLAEQTLNAILERVSDDQSMAAYLNQKRHMAIQRGTFCVVIACVLLGIQAIAYLYVQSGQ